MNCTAHGLAAITGALDRGNAILASKQAVGVARRAERHAGGAPPADRSRDAMHVRLGAMKAPRSMKSFLANFASCSDADGRNAWVTSIARTMSESLRAAGWY